MGTTNSALIRIIILVAVLIGFAAIYILTTLSSQSKPVQFKNNQTQDADISIGGDFTLTDQDGNIFDSKKLQGKLSFIYFGFTFCPDICPTSLGKLSVVLDTLEKYRINVNAVFITIDPSRDTSQLLKEYLSHFHHQIIGLTGSEIEIKNVADKFKVYYAKAVSQNLDSQNYMLDHTSFLYILDKKGKYLKHFYLNSSPEEIIEFVRINN